MKKDEARPLVSVTGTGLRFLQCFDNDG